MFIYLSKKIAIPNGIELRCLAWNPEHGWIACGGDEGLLKVLKLENSNGGKVNTGTTPKASSSLSMNQTLEGHQGAVVCVTWNANYRKLTTSDEQGLIIVWMLYKGVWFEEMINNRNKSVVKAMRWTADGQKICIVYEDGAVIIGSVDGNRLWGKELNIGLRNTEWCPNSSLVLFVTQDQDLHVYDAIGNKVKQLQLMSDPQSTKKKSKEIVDLHWYDGTEGYTDPKAPTLAVAFKSGLVQLLRGTDDTNDPIILRTGLKLGHCRWNSRGTVLACAGTSRHTDKKELSLVEFYSPYGIKLRTMKVPGGIIHGLTWEGGGLRLALAVDSFIYFANIRPDCQWGLFGDFNGKNNILVTAFSPAERSGLAVQFWNIATNKRFKRRTTRLHALRAAGDHCVLVESFAEEKYKVTLHDETGAQVDFRFAPVEPRFVAMTPYYIILIGERYVYLWQYARNHLITNNETDDTLVELVPAPFGLTKHTEVIPLRDSAGRERILDMDTDTVALLADAGDLKQDQEKFGHDAIVAMRVSEKVMIVGHTSGALRQYTLPHLAFDTSYHCSLVPWKIALNCNGTRLAVIDGNGALVIIDLTTEPAVKKKPPKQASKSARDEFDDDDDDDDDEEEYKRNDTQHPLRGAELEFERKDTWDIMWAQDDPYLFCAMEKTRLCVYRELENQRIEVVQDPIICPGYLSSFSKQRINSIVVEDVVQNPETCSHDSIFITNELKPLRELREVIRSEGLSQAFSMLQTTSRQVSNKSTDDDDGGQRTKIKQAEQQDLWSCLAESALEALDLNIAEKALVKCGDYRGICLVQRLRNTYGGDRMKQRAEVMTYLGRFDEAEQIYSDMDRKDLAVQLRSRLEDWTRVSSLVKKNGAGDDTQLTTAYKQLGERFGGAGNWEKAREYLEMAKDVKKLAQCYYRLNDFTKLERLLTDQAEVLESDILLRLGYMFESIGLVSPAVDAYAHAGERKKAIDCCILLNQWGKAVEIAEEFGFQQIEGLLVKYSTQLLKENKKLLAVELYRKANKPTDAAKLLATIAEESGVQRADPLRAKKLLVLAALEVERYRKKALDMTMTRTNTASIAQATAATLDTLMTHDRASGTGGSGAKVLDSAWRGAAAYHYFLLAHRQLYAGLFEAAKLTAIRLAEYEDVLCKHDIYALIALAAYHTQDFYICSRAFVKLETLDDIPNVERERIQNLAFTIFLDNPPNDVHHLPSCYLACLDTGTPYSACTLTGQACLNQRTLKCPTCRHHAIETELQGSSTFCPLCHSKYPAHVISL